MAAVLHSVLSGEHTVADIMKATGLTRPAAETVVDDLIQTGWVETANSPAKPQPLGRPASYFRLSSTAGNVLAIDLGAHHISAMVLTHAGETIARAETEIHENAPAEERLALAETLITRILPQSPNRILIAGIASPGVISDGTVSYFGGHGMPGWKGINLEKHFSNFLSTKVVVAGDCALGAQGESWRGVAKGKRDVLYVLAGRRTGAANVIDGRVHAGHAGAAGLVGELPALRWRELEDESFAAHIYGSKPLLRTEFFPLAAQGDPQALKAVAEYAEALSLGINAMILATAPETVVIGGRFAQYAPLFIPLLKKRIEQYCPFPPEVLASQLDGEEILLGAARFALNTLADRITDRVNNSDYFPAPTVESLWN
ncbi:MAG: ROK family transcriptional regulator [Arcanobacterium sp.]|nr:ROK family transcriptional regulator [Arcanobacterium sp.]